jgi:hydrogenase nickel incorporation protein HypA/HybF
MHEYSIATQIVNAVLQEAARHGANKVLEVHMVIGKLTLLGIEQMCFCYEILTRGSILEGSKLCIEERDARLKCPSCGYEGALEYENNSEYHLLIPTYSCPKCNGIMEITSGKECLIKSIKLAVQ